MSSIARLVHAAAAATGWSERRALGQGAMRILMLHGVGPTALPVAALDRLLARLQRRFELVTLAVLLERMEEPGRRTGREIALSFDDGLRHHGTVVAPLLAKRRAPATFFVCPGLVESGRWIWNHEGRARLARMAAGERAAWAADVGAPTGEVEAIVAWMKTLRPEARARAERALADATPAFAPTAAEREAYDPLSWDELAALDPDVVAIGSHTTTHPILTTLSPAEAEREIAGSGTLLERRLGRAVPHFCYPNGAEDPAVRDLARRHYDAALATTPGLVRPTSDRHALPRISVDASLSAVLWRLHRA
jgi:peptidoglycan/xylan/chitin deacetylase (PgdA/CDA1 family)